MYLNGGLSQRSPDLQFMGPGSFQIICPLLFSLPVFDLGVGFRIFDSSDRHLSAFEIFPVSKFLLNNLSSFISSSDFDFVGLSCSAFASRNNSSNSQCVHRLSRLAMILLTDPWLPFCVPARIGWGMTIAANFPASLIWSIVLHCDNATLSDSTKR